MRWLKRALSALSQGFTEMERSERDEAHLATRGDRPFPGCRPDAPNEEIPAAGPNPAQRTLDPVQPVQQFTGFKRRGASGRSIDVIGPGARRKTVGGKEAADRVDS